MSQRKTRLMEIHPQPGDVLAVASKPNWASKLIDIGQVIENLPGLDNHVVVVDHIDKDGKWQGIEGRPSGVGWVDLTVYLTHPATVSNQNQPRTDEQRAIICHTMQAMIGVAYDWEAILADAENVFGARLPWHENWNGTGYPGHAVCSALAAYGHIKADLPRPMKDHERFCKPGHWTKFSMNEEWAAA